MSKPGFPTTRTVGGLVTLAAAVSLAAACSSSKSTSPASSTSPPASTPPATAPAAAATVGSAMATVNGAQTTVLTAPDGHTLYYFTPDDTGGQPTCTGTCAALWPPLTAANPTEAAGVPGKLTLATGGNASQVIYNGHPLYEYKQDTSAGQANGEGFMGKWHVATPGLAAGSAPGMPAPSSPSTSGGGSGGY